MTTLLFEDDFTTLTNWTGGFTAAGRNGNGLSCTGTTTASRIVPPGQQSNKWTLGFAVQVSTLANARAFLQLRSAGVNHITVRAETTGAVTVLRGGTSGALIASSATGKMTAAAWYFVEVSVSLSDTVGTVEVRVNGVPVIGPLTGQDTIFSGAPAVFDEVDLMSTSGGNALFDDLYCTDDAFLNDGVPPRSLPTCTSVRDEPFDNISAWVNNNGAGVTIVPGRTGTAVRILNSGAGFLQYNIPTPSQSDYATCGFAFKFEAMQFGPTMFRFGSDGGATTHCSLQLDPTGVIQLRRGTGNTLATSTLTLIPGNWYYVEVQARMHDTAGYIVCRVNGAAFVAASGVDTKNAGTKTVFDFVGLNANTGTPCQFDDLYLTTGSGCPFLGDHPIGGAVSASGAGAVSFAGSATVTVKVPVSTPALPPPPGRVLYRIFTAWRGPSSIRSTVIDELVDARSLQLHFDLKGAATASCVIDGRSSSAAGVQELSQDLVVYRWNPYAASYAVIFRGPIGHTQDTVSETTHTVNIAAVDYRAMLARRPIGGPLHFAGVDQFTIAAALIDGAGPFAVAGDPWDMNLNAAGLYDPASTTLLPGTGVLRDRDYTGAEKTADMVNNLAAVLGGFDWGVEPLDPVFTPLGAAGQPVVWYPQRGVSKGFVADYGSTMASLSRTVDSTTFGNWVRNDGAPDDAGAPVFAVAAGDVVANPQLHAEGLWPLAVTNPSTTDPATLAEQAGGELAAASILMPSYALTLMPGAWRWRSDAWLGDTIGVRARSGRLDVNTTARIVQLDVSTNDNGTETVAVTVARILPTLADLLTEQRSTLDALTRR